MRRNALLGQIDQRWRTKRSHKSAFRHQSFLDHPKQNNPNPHFQGQSSLVYVRLAPCQHLAIALRHVKLRGFSYVTQGIAKSLLSGHIGIRCHAR